MDELCPVGLDTSRLEGLTRSRGHEATSLAISRCRSVGNDRRMRRYFSRTGLKSLMSQKVGQGKGRGEGSFGDGTTGTSKSPTLSIYCNSNFS